MGERSNRAVGGLAVFVHRNTGGSAMYQRAISGKATLALLAAWGLLSSCGGPGVGDSEAGESSTGVVTLASVSQLPVCTPAFRGVVYYTQDTGNFFYCTGSGMQWVDLHGQDGTSCTVGDNGDGTSTISCEDGTSVTVSDGADGARGVDGAPGADGADGQPGADGAEGPAGTSCTVTDHGDGTSTISCEDGTIATISDGQDGADGTPGADGAPGADGSDGSSCGVTDNGDGTKTIACDDGTSVTVSDGQDGADGEPGADGAEGPAGTSCSVTDNEDGTAKISCEDGTTATVSDGQDGADGASGISCWDLNGNGVCDLPSEDANGNGTCNALDCQGNDGADSAGVPLRRVHAFCGGTEDDFTLSATCFSLPCFVGTSQVFFFSCAGACYSSQVTPATCTNPIVGYMLDPGS